MPSTDVAFAAGGGGSGGAIAEADAGAGADSVVVGANLASASRYPGQVGDDNTFTEHGSTLYFKLKFTFVTSGPYGPNQ